MLPTKTANTVTVGTSPVTLYSFAPAANGCITWEYFVDNLGLTDRSGGLRLSWDKTDNICKLSEVSTADNVDYLTAPAPGCTLAKASSGTTCTDGVHRVKCTFYNANGETEMGTIDTGAVTVTGNDDVEVSGIPLCMDAAVTGRKVYMTTAGTTDYYLAATIANNTATTTTLAISDATLITQAAGPTANTTAQADSSALTFTATMSAGTVSLKASSTSGTWTVYTYEIARLFKTL